MNHVEVIEGLEVAIASLLQKVSICEVYAGIYCGVALQSIEDEPHLQRILDSALPEVYAAVIVFAVKARDYFEGGSTYALSPGYNSMLNQTQAEGNLQSHSSPLGSCFSHLLRK